MLRGPAARIHFIRATDLTNHHHAVGFWISFKAFQAVDEIHALHGVATNTNTGGLANASIGALPHRFVGQGA